MCLQFSTSTSVSYWQKQLFRFIISVNDVNIRHMCLHVFAGDDVAGIVAVAVVD